MMKIKRDRAKNKWIAALFNTVGSCTSKIETLEGMHMINETIMIFFLSRISTQEFLFGGYSKAEVEIKGK